jgi:hypothetical protein
LREGVHGSRFSLIVLYFSANDTVQHFPAILGDVEEARKEATALSSDRDEVLAKRADALETLAAFRSRANEMAQVSHLFKESGSKCGIFNLVFFLPSSLLTGTEV